LDPQDKTRIVFYSPYLIKVIVLSYNKGMFDTEKQRYFHKLDLESVGRIVEINRLQQVGSFFTFGRYDFGGINTVNDLVVMVHPISDFYGDSSGNIGYEKARDRVIRDRNDMVLIGLSVLEEEQTRKIIEWMRVVANDMPRMLYFTEYMKATPVQPEGRDFVVAIENQFHPKSVVVCGAEICLTVSGDLARFGCVNGTYRRLKESFNTFLDKSCSWVNSYSWPDNSVG
jgi:hypothetical protein